MEKLEYICDDMRHLICLPYSIENLHKMAIELGINRCWYHKSFKYPHYDIPKRRIQEIQAKCRVVSIRELHNLIVEGTKDMVFTSKYLQRKKNQKRNPT